MLKENKCDTSAIPKEVPKIFDNREVKQRKKTHKNQYLMSVVRDV